MIYTVLMIQKKSEFQRRIILCLAYNNNIIVSRPRRLGHETNPGHVVEMRAAAASDNSPIDAHCRGTRLLYASEQCPKGVKGEVRLKEGAARGLKKAREVCTAESLIHVDSLISLVSLSRWGCRSIRGLRRGEGEEGRGWYSSQGRITLTLACGYYLEAVQ